MAKILFMQNLAPSIYEFVVDAPLVAHKCQPGQFVMVRTDEYSERIPLTIADFDREKGTITLIVQAVGNTTKHMCETFKEGDNILDIAGPLGQPSHMKNFGTVVVVGGGIGVAPVYPIARAYHELGNKVISIIGARNKDLVIWQDKMAAISDEVIITTDDGTLGQKGFVTQVMEKIMSEEKKICSCGCGGTGKKKEYETPATGSGEMTLADLPVGSTATIATEMNLTSITQRLHNNIDSFFNRTHQSLIR